MLIDRADTLKVDLSRIAEEPALIVAVSGGSDSTAALILTYEEIQHRRSVTCLVAATVDHGLRPESADEARRVAKLCAKLGIEHRTLNWTEAKPATGIAEAGRLARYQLLSSLAEEIGARVVLTGHTADDQAETVTMRSARGEGIGLAGIAPATLYRNSIWFVRPLLGQRRQTLRGELTKRSISWIEDPTNLDRRYERPRIRLALQENPAGFAEALEVAQAAAGGRQALSRASAALVERAASRTDAGTLRIGRSELLAVPTDVSAYALRALIAAVGGAERLPDAARTAALLEKIAAGPCRFALARCLVDARASEIVLRPEQRSGRAARPAFLSPWRGLLPSFDWEIAAALAKVIEGPAPKALPWPY